MKNGLKTFLPAWLLLFLLQALFGALLVSDVAVAEGSLLWLLGANLLTTGLLLALARRMAPGPGRVLTLFAVWGGLQANNLVEAFFFGLEIPPELVGRLLLNQLLVAAGFAFAVDRLAGAGASHPGGAWPGPRPTLGWIGRVLATDAAYIFFYFAAGIAVFPFVAGFYSESMLPDPAHVLAMQVFRGLVFAGIVLTLLRRLDATPARAALLTGLALSVLGGVAPLLPPNPFMPAPVRLAHLVEVGVSNLVFGWVAARWLGASAKSAPATRTGERPHLAA